jgi:hypothetical protein
MMLRREKSLASAGNQTLAIQCIAILNELSWLQDPEDGRCMFLQNSGWLSPDYTALHPRRQKSSKSLL